MNIIKIFYIFWMIAGVVSSGVLGALFLAKYNYSIPSFFLFAVLLLCIEFGCFAFRDWKYEFPSV